MISEFLKEKMVYNLKHVPSKCQNNLFSKLSIFMQEPMETWLMLISGYAGTGKTSAISAYIKVLREFKINFILLAPTGRAAKVLSSYSSYKAKTIHKQIYRQKTIDDSGGYFTLDYNKNANTVFIVDEASLISIGDSSINNIFGSGNLLEDLFSYVNSNNGNRLILIGDPAQLPPIGFSQSPALDYSYLSNYCSNIISAKLSTVVRQKEESGILYNATILRNLIESNLPDKLLFDLSGFADIKRITGAELIEELSDSIDKWGIDDVVVLCRSNNRANKYNQGIRQRILYREERINKGDKLMVVKNCYQFLDSIEEIDFIANGDVVQLERIWAYEQRYGLQFANAMLSFPDYNNIEITCKVILDTLDSSSAALSAEQQKELFNGVYQDYFNIPTKKKRLAAVKEDKYFNALQVKYASAITGHKSQGGQWKCVFIDNNIWSDDISLDDIKWLYTALTRGIEKVYLVSFKDAFFAPL